jgi:GNAT superfamily N-acetyltransferase
MYINGIILFDAMEAVNIEHKGYLITTDKEKMKPGQIHKWLSEESYWAKNIPYKIVKGSFDNSFCIGIIKGDEQIGYGRFITDYTTFAYLADVYVKEAHRAKGLGKLMMQILMNLDWVKGLRFLMLATKDAHDLYRQYGFTEPLFPERIMQIRRPDIYTGNTNNRE